MPDIVLNHNKPLGAVIYHNIVPISFSGNKEIKKLVFYYMLLIYDTYSVWILIDGLDLL